MITVFHYKRQVRNMFPQKTFILLAVRPAVKAIYMALQLAGSTSKNIFPSSSIACSNSQEHVGT